MIVRSSERIADSWIGLPSAAALLGGLHCAAGLGPLAFSLAGNRSHKHDVITLPSLSLCRLTDFCILPFGTFYGSLLDTRQDDVLMSAFVVSRFEG